MPSLRTATNPTKMEHRMGFNFCGSKLLRMAAFHNIHSFCFHGCRSLMYYILCIHYISLLIQTMIKLYVAGMSHFKEMRLKHSESEHSEALTAFFFANLPCFYFATVAAHLSVALSAFPLRNPCATVTLTAWLLNHLLHQSYASHLLCTAVLISLTLP